MTSRRAFLRSLVPLAGALVAACRPASTPIPAATRGLPPTRSEPPTPAQPPQPALPPPEAGRLTPVEDLYRQTYTSPVPVLDRAGWAAAIEGEARAPYTLAWADLQAWPAVERMQTLECIGNPIGGRLIGNVLWRGVSLRDLLARADPGPAARYLVMSAADEYYTSVPLDLAMDERSLLAFAANGEPLPPAHGFPARILLPGVYGQKQPKWVTSLRLSDRYVQGTWEKQGWSDEAAIRINSRIEHPRQGDRLPANRPVLVSGVAFADLSGVARLDVSPDGGQTWHEATLLPGPSTTVWTVWHWAWPSPPPGPQVLQARAVDGRGMAQTPANPRPSGQGPGGGLLAGVFPNGTSGIHSVVVEVA